MVGTGTITSNGNTTLAAMTISSTSGTTTLGAAFTMSATSTLTLTSGSLALNGFNLTTGIFSSTNSNTRSIAFGTNNIVLAHTTAAQTVLSMSAATGFTWTGTGGFTSDASVTRTYVFGVTGGGIANSPNVSLTGTGSSQQTFTTNSWFNKLDFGSTTMTVSSSTINLSALTLSVGGTFTNLNIVMLGTGTIISNNKTVAAFTVNSWTIANSTTLSGNLACTTFTQTFGTIDFAGYNLTCSSTATYYNGTLTNIGTISCTTFTINGASFTFSSGTIPHKALLWTNNGKMAKLLISSKEKFPAR
jgi:hypothetical protein